MIAVIEVCKYVFCLFVHFIFPIRILSCITHSSIENVGVHREVLVSCRKKTQQKTKNRPAIEILK